MTIEAWLSCQSQRIRSDSPRLDAELLLAERLGKTRAYLLAFGDQDIPEAVLKRLDREADQLSAGYPVAYLLGKKAFWDMELNVSPATLIPRADTETLIEVVQTLFPADTQATMIDLGTGSGAIAIALSREFINAAISATDISDDALVIAKSNAARWQTAPITFFKRAWLTGFPPQSFDLIVSNPPYIAEDDVHLGHLHGEPLTALTSGEQGLADIKTIIQQSQTALKSGGWLVLEHGYRQGQAVRRLLANAGWQQVKTSKDLGGNERITAARKCGW